jgi:hypothetical protein
LIPDPEQSSWRAEKDGTTYVCPLCHSDSALVERLDDYPSIHWIICGGESGPGARPMHPEWARSLHKQCQAAQVPFFFKQWGDWLPHGQGGGYLNGYHEKKDLSPFSPYPSRTPSYRVGKAKAGRLLDGKEHNAIPT